MKTIRLYGTLAKKFGEYHQLNVKSVAEAMRAMQANFPAFKSTISKGTWQFFTSRKKSRLPVKMETLKFPLGRADTLHIAPPGKVAGIEIGAALLIGALVVSAAAVTIALLAPLSSVVGQSIRISEVPLSYFGGATPGIPNYPNGPGYQVITNWLGKGGGKSGGGSQRSAQEDRNTLQSNASVRLLEVIAVGINEGLADPVNPLKSVALDGTQVQNDDGTFNFNGFALDVRTGEADQSHIEGFNSQEVTIAKGVEITNAGGAITHTITDDDIDSARVTIRIPSLWKQDTENGDLKFHQVKCDIKLQSDGGGYQSIFTGAAANSKALFDGKCTADYQREYEIKLPAGGAPYDIQVSRISGDTPAANIQDDTFLDFVTEATDVKLSWPGISYVGISADIRQFGTRISTRSYHWKGAHIKVPTNFDPVARTYSGSWDGTFKFVYSDDPAWCLYDLATDDFFGAGRLTKGNVDPWAFFAASKYCNEQVPDGKGGTEPRYRLSAIIKSKAQAIKVFNTVASVFRAAVYWGTDGLTVIQDRPEADENKPIIVPANNSLGSPHGWPGGQDGALGTG